MSGTREAIRVSVVITTYNRCRLVCEAIDSVFRQHHPNTEVIVIDDGSSDGTAAVLAEKYGVAVTCLEQVNRGFGAARNRGVEAATGRYIAFLDSDDIWLDGKLALQLEVMERFPELAYCFSDFVIFNDAGRYDHHGLESWFSGPTAWEELLPRRERVYAEQSVGDRSGGEVSVFIGELYRPMLSQCYVLPTTAMVRASCIDERIRHTENDPYCADWDFFALLSRNHPAGFIATETALNRSHDDAVRLTRSLDEAEKAGYRLASIGRVWKADRDFVGRHGDKIARVEAGLLLRQAKSWYLGGRAAQSREALVAYRRCGAAGGRKAAQVLGVLTMIPYSAPLVRTLLNVRRKIRGTQRNRHR